MTIVDCFGILALEEKLKEWNGRGEKKSLRRGTVGHTRRDEKTKERDEKQARATAQGTGLARVERTEERVGPKRMMRDRKGF